MSRRDIVPDAFIVGAVRTPVGKRGGGLSQVHPADLAAHVIRALLGRTGVPGAEVDDVIFGCVSQVGAQAFNIARIAALSAGLPESVPGTTVDRQCGSSQQAVHFAAQAIRSGDQDLVIAGGVEVMSLVPIGSAAALGESAGQGVPRGGQFWQQRYPSEEVSQFRGAELIAEQWQISPDQMADYSLRSHELALASAAAGIWDEEISSCAGLDHDEGPRVGTSREKMLALKPLRPGGTINAAFASQISDAAAALLLASESAVLRLGLAPLARIRATAVVGSDPVMMLTGPIPATAEVLKRAGLSLGDIGLFEVNEAFASVVLAWLAETGAPVDRTNSQGGAIALGHPLGATGARLMTSLVHQMRRTGSRLGLQTMCEGGGMANATILELLPGRGM
jgi:acetyl-CoA C-acetyltransferase